MANHIQIKAIAPRIQYVGDGVQSVFTYPFAIFQDVDLEVYVDGVKQTAGYVVSGAGNTAGGAVTFSLAPVGGASVTLNRNIAIARTSDFQDAGEFRAKVINDELDIMTAALQQVVDAQSRALQLSVTQTGMIDTAISGPTANTTLMWNATADGLTNGPSADAIVAVQANAVQVAADRVQVGLDASAAATSSASAAGSAANASAVVAAPGAKIDDVIALSGLTPDSANTTQLSTAIVNLILTKAPDHSVLLRKQLLLNSLLNTMSSGAGVRILDALTDPYVDLSKVNLVASSGYMHTVGGAYIENTALAEFPPAAATSNLGNQAASTVASIVDGSWTTLWDVNDTANWLNNYVTLDAGVGLAPVVRQIKMSVNIASPWGAITMTVQGSNDNVTFLPIATGVSIVFVSDKTATLSDIFNNATGYRYTRIVFEVSRSGASCDIAELHLMQTGIAPNMVLTSTTIIASAVPGHGYLLGIVEPVDAVVLNTDLCADLTRDGGTTWEVLTLQQIGTAAAGQIIVYGDLAFAGGAAQNVASRWRSYNAKHIKLQGSILDAEA